MARNESSKTSMAKKKQLLEIAKNEDERPSTIKHPLGRALVNYTCKSGDSYDAEFDAEIRKLRPDWFEK